MGFHEPVSSSPISVVASVIMPFASWTPAYSLDLKPLMSHFWQMGEVFLRNNLFDFLWKAISKLVIFASNDVIPLSIKFKLLMNSQILI